MPGGAVVEQRLLSHSGTIAACLASTGSPPTPPSATASLSFVACVIRLRVTKDRDFRDSHLLGGTPRRLLAVLTGNITNAALLTLFDTHLEQFVAALDESHFVELDSTSLTLHEDRPTD